MGLRILLEEAGNLQREQGQNVCQLPAYTECQYPYTGLPPSFGKRFSIRPVPPPLSYNGEP